MVIRFSGFLLTPQEKLRLYRKLRRLPRQQRILLNRKILFTGDLTPAAQALSRYM